MVKIQVQIMAAINTIIFDLGGVLIDWNPKYVFNETYFDSIEKRDYFLTTICTLAVSYTHLDVYKRQEYYQPLMENIEWMAQQGTISKEDMSLVLITDSIDEAMQHISNYISTNYKVRPRKRYWWLFEKR